VITYTHLILACWLIFAGYWAFSALRAKKNIRGPSFRNGMYFRLALIVAVIVVLHFTGNRYWLWHADPALRTDSVHGFFSSTLVRSIGVALCAFGIALAIWARTVIGRNWGMPMSLKENPELVTSGPYAHIRHPIYTGTLTAVLGSTLTLGAILFIPFLFFGAYFIYSAMKEEATMARLFPGTYAEYKGRTSMLIPFVL
jgi:protein-S-isoprenylcysteine O-methyltransferase Ste14